MALRAAFAGIIAEHDDAQRQDDESDDDQEDGPRRKLPVRGIRTAQIQFAAFEQLRRGFDARDHAAAVVALAEGGQHVFQLNPLADGVGKHAFKPSARDEADFTPVPDQQDAQPVVVLGAPHAPLRKEIDGEIEDVAARNVVHGHHGHLSDRPVTERPADRVDTRHGAGRKDTVGIRHVARTVGALDIGDILGAVAPGLRRKARKEQQAKNDKASHIHRQK